VILVNTIQVPTDDVLKQSAISRDVTLAVGDTLKVTLGSNHTTPYHWTAEAKIGDGAVLKQISHDYVRPDSAALGAPGVEVWMFAALKAGSTTVATDYTSIVGSDPMPVCTFTARVTVE
jgi:inhibitor of cysteine peptidase